LGIYTANLAIMQPYEAFGKTSGLWPPYSWGL